MYLKILNKLNLEKLYQSGLFESQLYSEDNPLIITKEEIDKGLTIISEALKIADEATY